jgi:peroxiredoxin
MRKLALVLFFFITGLIHSTQCQVLINYQISGLNDQTVYLNAVSGNEMRLRDSVKSINGLIRFSIPDQWPAGVYRISFDQSLFTDLIVNHENIILKNDIHSLLDSLNIQTSEENKIFYEYWRKSIYLSDSIDLISQLGYSIFVHNNYVVTPDVDSLANVLIKLKDKQKNLAHKLINTSQGMFVQKMLQAYDEPDMEAYNATHSQNKYTDENRFKREHYFDNVDFGDSLLLNSEVFYVLTMDYLTKHIDKPCDSAYIAAMDLIMEKCQPCSPVFKYLRQLFLGTFADTEWEGAFVHLVDHYVRGRFCNQEIPEVVLEQKANVIHQLKPGNTAPDFILPDTTGKPVQLKKIKAKAILLDFWSGNCSHCEKTIPQLVSIYQKYHNSGLEIISISVDTDPQIWKPAINKYKLPWIHAGDMKGQDSEVIIHYNAFSTPVFYVLDKNKKIISHPISSTDLNSALEKIFGF